MKYNTQNAKIASITEKSLIVGIDVGSETHFARAFDWRNYEYTGKPFEFRNNEAGFLAFKAWVEDLRDHRQIRCNSRNGAHRPLLVCSREIPAGQWDETGACQSSSRKKVERAG